MAKIEIPDELYNKLMEIAEEVTTQDHRATKQPYFIQIEEPKEIWGMEDGYADDGEWILDGGGGQTVDPEDDEELKELLLEHELIREEDDNENIDLPTFNEYLKDQDENEGNDREAIIENLGYRYCRKKVIEKYSNCFLTSKGAKEYIENNKHNLHDDARTYLFYADRNPEMRTIFEFLCGLKGKGIHQ